ncbi:MAG TPA: DUF2933 domain-containing protein [Acidimicrobiales bacterium]|nr:DUF2933 domain-containing protein [Acidimicrobiales bacterium]
MRRVKLSHCLIGIAAAALLLVSFGVNPGTVMYGALGLACPVMMVLMMAGMMGRHGHRRAGSGGMEQR